MDPERLLDGLDPDQRLAVTSPAAPLCILAPAGSGKTRVLTRRIAHRIASEQADPRHVVALTFTRKAAAELSARLRRLGLREDVVAGTFHSVAYAQLRSRWADQRATPPTLLDRKSRLLHDLLPRSARRDGRTVTSQLASEIEWATARMVRPDGYVAAVEAAQRRTQLPRELVAERFADYEAAKRERNLVDFDDLLGLCIAALEHDERFAAAQRWRFRHLFVDELQDVNPLQFRLLETWRNRRDDACAVGDPQQAIYGWNGADPSFLSELGDHWRGLEVLELHRSYRSTPQILAAATAVLRSARQPARSVQAARSDGLAVELAGHADDRAEALAVARAVRLARRPGRPWADQAILVRTHAQTALLTEALRGDRIPHRVRGSAALLDNPTVQRALRDLRASHQPLAVALADLDTDLAARQAILATAADDREDLDAQEAQSGEIAGLTLLSELGADYLRLDPTGRPAGFAAWLAATVQREGAESGGDAVTLATFHAAKGLEWPIVHLAGLEDGFVPLAHARSAAARAEEARVLYVAMTRASEELHLSWSSQRTFSGKVVERRRSPLLDGCARQAGHTDGRPSEPSPAAPDADWRQCLDEQRTILARARSGEDPRIRALRRWRDTAARAARIEPTALLRDDVLERIVTSEPVDVAALGAISGVGPLFADRFGDAMLEALGRR